MAIHIQGKTTDQQKFGGKVVKQEGKVYFIQKVIKNDTFMVLADASVEIEDEWSGLYYTTQDSAKVVLQPPYVPTDLLLLTTKNNVLSQCIEAMEVNIDGTGHEFEPAEVGGTMDKAEVKAATDFFNEPFPGVSFMKQRRILRRDLESTGYAWMEALRNINGDLVGVRNVKSHTTRCLKLDAAVQVTKKINRGGKEVDLTYMERERRFAQQIGAQQKLSYFREFGATRQINRATGDWGDDAAVKAEDRGTELIFFTVIPDVTSPYGVPRWINQLPSVVGSRKAEEQNLEYFDAGGVPPAIIFIQGGTLAKDMSDQLKLYLSGQTKSRNRVVVVEAQSSSGQLDQVGSVQVKVERFGSQNVDAMFEKYDDTSYNHVRMAFRLPDLFLGEGKSLNFATALTTYMMAEAQVFQPERAAFDEIVNKTIMPALGFKTIKFKSNPITLKNIDAQLKAMQMIANIVDPKGLVDEVNKIAGVTLEYKEGTAMPMPNSGGKPVPLLPGENQDKVPPGAPRDGALPKTAGGLPPPAKATGKFPPGKFPVKKAEQLVELARTYSQARGLLPGGEEMTIMQKAEIQQEVQSLKGEEYREFLTTLAQHTFGRASNSLIALAHGCVHHVP